MTVQNVSDIPNQNLVGKQVQLQTGVCFYYGVVRDVGPAFHGDQPVLVFIERDEQGALPQPEEAVYLLNHNNITVNSHVTAKPIPMAPREPLLR